MNLFHYNFGKQIKDKIAKILPVRRGLVSYTKMQFPAMHLRIQRPQYIYHFSPEGLLILMSLMALASSLYFVRIKQDDQSFTTKLLGYHETLNPELYAKEHTIKTVIVSQQHIIQTAFAKNPTSPQADETNANTIIQDNTLLKPHPDSIQTLVTKPIEMYQIKPGDTISELARTFNISEGTIGKVNNLTDHSILKIGQTLQILPTNGMLHTVRSSDTLPDIAKKYGVTMENVITYNGLANAEDIDDGQILIIPGGKLDTKNASAQKTITRTTYLANAKAEHDLEAANHFPWGYCTWYVATKARVSWTGHAKSWIGEAKKAGAIIANTPIAGAIVVTTNSPWGHVAYVESLDADGFTVSEMNYDKFGIVDTRHMLHSDSTIRAFIYP